MDIYNQAQALKTEELDELIAKLGQLRAGREPAIQTDPPMGEKKEAIGDPKVWTEPHPMIPGWTLFGIRHPGFGWLLFSLPAETRRALIGYFQHQEEIALIPPLPSSLN